MAALPAWLVLELEGIRNERLPIEKIAEYLYVTRLLNAVALAILCYDTIILFDEEVRYLWPKKMSLVKVLLYLNRAICFTFTALNAAHFIGLRKSFSMDFCKTAIVGVGYASMLCFAMSNWILLARTRALLGSRYRYFSIALIVYYCLSYASTAYLTYRVTSALAPKSFYSFNLRICATAVHPKIMGFVWIPSMVFETSMFLITIFKLYQQRSAPHGASIGLSTNLFYVLFRDGASYYVIIMALRTWNLFAWAALPSSLAYTGIFILWSVMSVAVMRLQLNLIKAADPSVILTGPSKGPTDVSLSALNSGKVSGQIPRFVAPGGIGNGRRTNEPLSTFFSDEVDVYGDYASNGPQARRWY